MLILPDPTRISVRLLLVPGCIGVEDPLRRIPMSQTDNNHAAPMPLDWT